MSNLPTSIDDLVPPLPRVSPSAPPPKEPPRPRHISPRGRTKPISGEPVLVAVADPLLHPEVTTIVAATGRQRLDTTEPAEITRHGHRASALIIDPETARGLGASQLRVPVFLVHPEPGPVDWKLAMDIRAEEAFILPAQAPELLRALGRGEDPTEPDAATVTVCGAVGGAGTSTLAAAIARDRGTCVLVDADPCSGGLDLLLGLEDSLGIRWSDLDFTRGQMAASELLKALPRAGDGPRVLTHSRGDLGRAEIAPEQLVGAIDCLRGHASVVIDSPAHGEGFEVACEASDLIVVVVPAEVRAAVSAHALVGRLQAKRHRVIAVLRHRGWSGLDREDIEQLAKVEVVAEVATVARLHKKVETAGLPARLPATIARAAKKVGEALAA